PDSAGILTSATINIGNFVSGDTLLFSSQNSITGTFNATTGVETLTGSASVAAYQTALESIEYGFTTPYGDPTANGSQPSRTITWTVNDGVATASATSTLNEIHVPGSVTAGGTVTYTGAAVALDPTLAVADIDSNGTLAGAVVTIDNFSAGDTLQFTTQFGITGSFSAGTLTLTGATTLANYQAALESVQYATTSAVQSVRTIDWAIKDGASTSSAATSSVDVICFCPGTLIGTPTGQVQVEKLQPGDTVLTAHNGPRTVKWIGHGKVLASRGKRTAATPVIVRKDALGDNLPTRDLHVTKAHSLYIDDVLIPVEFLVNHKTILWDDRAREVEVYHVELDSHDIIFANGAPAETYRDDGNRWLFRNASPGWDSAPQPPCVPVLTGGPIVDAIWKRLLDRAGHRDLPPLTTDPDLHLIADGKRMEIAARQGQHRIFRLARRPETLVIASRDAVPAELGLTRDPRSLGVALRHITLRQDDAIETISAGDTRLEDGFHAYETTEQLRWTNGHALLPPSLFARFDAGGIEITLTLAGNTHYPEPGEVWQRSAA
ncbi:MAG TPA: Hint domain-containing protein, partial [Rhodopila sp.]|nr:Hint domain-containing protein [Rhodopila sp.]